MATGFVNGKMQFSHGSLRGLSQHVTDARWWTTAILETSENCYMSATVRAFLTKFGRMMQFDPLDHSNHYNFEMLKIQDGGIAYILHFFNIYTNSL